MLNPIYYRIFKYVMSSTKEGRLKIKLPDGKEIVFGNPKAETVEVRVLAWSFFAFVIRDGGIGLGESYMAGLWETDDLTKFLNFLIHNKKHFDDRAKPFKGVGHAFNALMHRMRRNTLRGSAKNIQDHYDLSNEFFSLFLDPTMTYSSAVFEKEGESLERAQINKIRKLARMINISKDDHVLEIGCGWGAFAIDTVRQTGCRWTGLTLSKEQKKWADTKIAEAGLQDKIEILLVDYRHAQGAYDKIVSVEMIEAVGHEYLMVYFDSCAHLLKPGGKMALQAITIPHNRYEDYRKNCDWIQKYIFPGGHLPSVEIIEALSHRAGLKMGQLDRIGQDYATTLAMWWQAMRANRELILKKGYSEAFIRKWQYYFCYCEAGFRSGFIDDIQVSLNKPVNK